MFQLEEQGGEAKAVGWISMSDMFLLCSVVLLAGAMLLAGNLKNVKDTSQKHISELEQQLVDLKRLQGFETEALAKIAALEESKKKQADDLTRLTAELAAATNRAARLTAELAASKAAYAKALENQEALEKANKEIATLKHDIDELTIANKTLADQKENLDKIVAGLEKQAAMLKAALNDRDAEIARLKAEMEHLKDDYGISPADLARLKKELEDLRKEHGISKAEIERLMKELAEANQKYNSQKEQVAKLTEQIHEKVVKAKLVITVTPDTLPTDFRLEIFVVDPLGNECCPLSPSVFNDGYEIAGLVQGADVKSGTATYYSDTLLPSNANGGYKVFAMIRHIKDDLNIRLDKPVTVRWKVELNGTTTLTDSFEFKTRGAILLKKSTEPLVNTTKFKNLWPWEVDGWVGREQLSAFKVDGGTNGGLVKLNLDPASTQVGSGAAGSGTNTGQTRGFGTFR